MGLLRSVGRRSSSWSLVSRWLVLSKSSSKSSFSTTCFSGMPRGHTRSELSSTLTSSFGSVRLDVSPSVHGEEEEHEEELVRLQEEREMVNASRRVRDELLEQTISARVNSAQTGSSSSSDESRREVQDLTNEEWYFEDVETAAKWTTSPTRTSVSNKMRGQPESKKLQKEPSKESVQESFKTAMENNDSTSLPLYDSHKSDWSGVRSGENEASEVDRQYFSSALDLESSLSNNSLEVRVDSSSTEKMRDTWLHSVKDLNVIDRQLMMGEELSTEKSSIEPTIKPFKKSVKDRKESLKKKTTFDPDSPPTMSALLYVKQLRSGSKKAVPKSKEQFVEEIGVSLEKRLYAAATNTPLVSVDTKKRGKALKAPDIISETQLDDRFKSDNLEMLTSIEVMERLRKKIVFHDHDIVAINKLYGLPIFKGGDGSAHYLMKYLDDLAQLVDAERLHMVHRLDASTTGILLLAKTIEAQEKLCELFKHRKIDKRYWAVLRGTPQPQQGIISVPIQEIKLGNRHRMTVQPDYSHSSLITNKKTSSTEVMPAVTEYRVLSSANGTSLVEFKPITGYRHQVRVHAGLALGCPVIGDHKYSYIDEVGKPQKLAGETLHRLGIRQSRVRDLPLFLHAKHIQIPEWVPNKNVYVDAAMPHCFCRLIRRLKLQPTSFVAV